MSNPTNDFLISTFANREPDQIIGYPDDPIQHRWVLIPRSPVNDYVLFLNHHLHSEIYQDPHDHPWDNASIILRGGYWDITDTERIWRKVGDIIERKAREPHRLELEPDIECWTLFLVGRRIFPDWGFLTSTGYVDQETYRDEMRKRRNSILK